MRTIKFGQDFRKLQEDFFTTIRMPPKDLRSGEIVLIKTPTTEFKGIIIKHNTHILNDICTDLLMDDTGTESREDAIMVLREFYPTLDGYSRVQVIWIVHDRRGD